MLNCIVTAEDDFRAGNAAFYNDSGIGWVLGLGDRAYRLWQSTFARFRHHAVAKAPPTNKIRWQRDLHWRFALAGRKPDLHANRTIASEAGQGAECNSPVGQND
jgi:hypothetical protein